MEPRKYHVDIYWSEEDQLYLAEVPELPGCLTHGETVVEAAQNAEEVIEAWIEIAEEAGDPVPPPVVERHYSGRFLARIPRDLHADLALEAERQGVSLNQYVLAQLAGASGASRKRRAPRRTRPADDQARPANPAAAPDSCGAKKPVKAT